MIKTFLDCFKRGADVQNSNQKDVSLVTKMAENMQVFQFPSFFVSKTNSIYLHVSKNINLVPCTIIEGFRI